MIQEQAKTLYYVKLLYNLFLFFFRFFLFTFNFFGSVRPAKKEEDI